MTRRNAISLILLAALSSARASAQTKIVSEKLAEGIWAAPTPGGSNVGWFVVGDTVIAVDAGTSDEIGHALVQEIQKTTGQKPRYLVITHAHRDHAGGASAFAAAGTQILSAEKAAPGVLFVLDPASRGGAAAKPNASKPVGSPVVMTVAERSLLLAGAPRRAEIYHLGSGHTQGDLIVVLPNDGVLFSGDLAVNGVLPFLRSADVDPSGWERILPRLAALRIERMVPGHGQIGPREGIAATAAYIRRVNEIAANLVLGNVPESMYEVQLRAPENAIENVPISPEHVANVKAVCQVVRARREEAPAPAPSAPPSPTPTSRKP